MEMGKCNDYGASVHPKLFWISQLVSIFSFLPALVGGISFEDSGPRFLQDFPSTFTYSNVHGGKLVCEASGEPRPRVGWLTADLLPVDNITSVPEVEEDGSLVFRPFEWQYYRADIHSGRYRCRASNAVGTIISTEIRTRPVTDLPFEVDASETVAFKGNVAILRCLVPVELKDFVTVTSWVQDGAINIYPAFQTDKYLVLPNGDLFVFHVDASDEFKSFACRASSKLNNQVKTSRSVRIIVREIESPERVQLAVPREINVRGRTGEDMYLPCAGSGNPPPDYTWYREIDGVQTEVYGKSRTRADSMNQHGSRQIGPLLLLSQVRSEDSGVYVCRVNNSVSQTEARVTVQVYVPLHVQLSPTSLTVDVGRVASFRCLVSGSPVHDISWFKDGGPINSPAFHRYRVFPPDTLSIMHVRVDDAGMYQCFASNDVHSVQDSAQLRLGSVMPELTYRFAEQTLQAGPSVSLKCTAIGNPPPQFTWALDGFPLPESERFLVGQYVTIHDHVISHVNITSVKSEDGGLYSCQASNSMGSAVHSARLNIYGPPYIREIPPVKATAGRTLSISCPVSGYPIESISWERGGSSLPVSRQQRVFPNGTLIIENIQRGTDEGIYTCLARNRVGLFSSRDIHIQVVVPPKIMPFRFMNEYLQEGRRLSVSCQILEGDKPIEFTWLYKGTPISSSLSSGISIRIPDEYSSTLVIDSLASSHNGEYSCAAENSAGRDVHTDTLAVNVPPKWIVEPRDINVAAGQLVTLQCQAEGHPKPVITWKRASRNQPGEYKELVGSRGTFVHTNGTIRFESIRKAEEGQYLCEAGNGFGSGLSKVVIVKVNAAVELIDRDEEISVKAGDRAILPCRARGDLPIEIQWSHQGVKLNPKSSNNRYSTRQRETTEGVIVAELLISDAGRSDGGIYNCRASNAYGTDQTTVKLKIQEPPEQPTNLRLMEEMSRSIQVSWSEGFNGNSPLINFILQYKYPSETWTEAEVKEVTVPATQTIAILPGLSPSTTYHLRVLAQNSMGFSRPSDIIQVTTAEEAPEGSPTDVHVLPVTSTRLRVQWSAPEKSLWHGNILGYYVGYREIGLALLLGNGGNTNNAGSFSATNNGDRHREGAIRASSVSAAGGLSKETNGYHFTTVEVGVNFGGMAVIDNLRKYTTYAVVVQAFNSKGTGPLSHPVVGTTEQDVPSAPPEKMTCMATSPSSLQVSVEDPPLESQNGVIQGYKVMHQVAAESISDPNKPDETWWIPNAVVPDADATEDEEFPVEIKLTTSQMTTIHGLRTYTNYSVSALAFTTVGDGVLSRPILCQTEEDVPSAPADMKALVSSRRSILLSWLPPLQPNGRIAKFTIYIRPQESQQTESRVVDGTEGHYEVIGLKEGQSYEFWMTASTSVGEGAASRQIQISPSSKVPARIASFGGTFRVPWKRDLLLRCESVGIPEPKIVWTFNGKDYMDSAFTNAEQAKMGSRIDVVKLGQITPEQAGNYTCRVTNPHGTDSISYQVIVLVPPEQPKLSLLEAFHDSLRLSWTVAHNGGSRIRGYVINYRRDGGEWEEYKITAAAGSGDSNHLLGGLICGSKYQLFMTAFNKIGTSKPSEIISAKTKGEIVPPPGRKEQVLMGNSTGISIRLDGWRSSLCPVLRFRIQYKLQAGREWTVAAADLPGDKGSFTVENLEPGKRYDVRVEAVNPAGTSVGNFSFDTPAGHSTLDEGQYDGRLQEGPADEKAEEEGGSTSLLIILPLFLSFFAVLGVIAVVFYFRRRRWASDGPKTVISNPDGSGLQVLMQQGRHNGDEDRYWVFKGTSSVSGDPSVIYQEPLRGKSDSDYTDDVCPYATFQLPAKTPQRPRLTKLAGNDARERTLGPGGTLGRRSMRHSGDTMYSSGNIYCGPYHSVQSGATAADGSEIFYDQATLPLREAEYGRHHRHRHRKELQEGAESDNLGSTDSEVKKILTLHMPISEHYDTLGSDSEGEKRLEDESATGFSPSDSSQSSSAVGERGHAEARGKGKHPRQKIRSRSGGQSSANSSMKTRVRSSSGYSSHTEETSFSLCERIQPPSRFSDSRDQSVFDDELQEGAPTDMEPMPLRLNNSRPMKRAHAEQTKSSISQSRRRNPTYHIDL